MRFVFCVSRRFAGSVAGVEAFVLTMVRGSEMALAAAFADATFDGLDGVWDLVDFSWEVAAALGVRFAVFWAVADEEVEARRGVTSGFFFAPADDASALVRETFDAVFGLGEEAGGLPVFFTAAAGAT